METIKELKNRHTKEINNFNIGAAFNDEQFERMMTKFGLDVNDTSKIVSIGAGMFILKEEKDLFKELLKRHKKELADFKKDRKNHIESILCDFNHFDVDYRFGFNTSIETIGLSEKDLAEDPKLKDVVLAAWKKFVKQQHESEN